MRASRVRLGAASVLGVTAIASLCLVFGGHDSAPTTSASPRLQSASDVAAEKAKAQAAQQAHEKQWLADQQAAAAKAAADAAAAAQAQAQVQAQAQAASGAPGQSRPEPVTAGGSRFTTTGGGSFTTIVHGQPPAQAQAPAPVPAPPNQQPGTITFTVPNPPGPTQQQLNQQWLNNYTQQQQSNYDPMQHQGP